MSDEAEKVSEELCISFSKLQEDEGAKGIQNIGKALDLVAKSGDGEFRQIICNNLSYFQSMLPDDVKLQPFIKAVPKMCEIIKATLLLPDDDGTVKADDYSKKGIQEGGKELAKIMYNYACMNDPFGSAAWGPVIDVLDAVAGVKMKEATPLRNYGSQISRLETIQSLMRVKPPYGSTTKAPPKTVDVLVKYVGKEMPKSVVSEASSNISVLSSSDPTALDGKARAIFACIEAGVTSMNTVLTSSYTTLYKTDPAAFHDNIKVIMEIDFLYASGMLYAISEKNGAVLVPYIPKFLEMLEKGVQYNMETMVLTILNGVAASSPKDMYNVVDKLLPLGLKVSNGDITTAMIVGRCGEAKVPGASEKVIGLLVQILKHPGLSAYAPASVLSSIVNQLPNLNGNTKVLDPHMETILKFEGASAQVVEKIKDWHAGRSLENVDARLQAVEAKIKAMNEEFSKQCKNFDDVSKLMDSKIADLKDFVGEIVKKLPQPYKLTVVGGVKKTLVLHFKSAKSAKEVTTETKVWNQWCKIGFGLMKLGKCAAEVAAGNPIALAGGVGAIKDIYSSYKTKDDADFDTFITQPFLTSAEQDRLIEQLRDGGFFEKMAYDAQLGDWILVSEMSDKQAAKKDAKDQKTQQTLANQEKVKGKNMGLGSAGDIVGAAIEAADVAGVGVGGMSVGEVAGTVGDVASGAKIVANGVAGAVGKGAKSPESTAIIKAPAPPRGGFFASMFGGPSKKKVTEHDDKIAQLEKRVAQLEATVKDLLARQRT